MHPRAATLLLGSLFLASCTLSFGNGSSGQGGESSQPIPTLTDGAVCTDHLECKSGMCMDNLCEGAHCACSGGECDDSGTASTDCEAGWLCVHHPASTDFFGFTISSFNRCQASCPVCPAHHTCTEGASFCEADSSWTELTVTATATPDHIAPGESVSLTATATSPTGDIDFDFTWKFNDAVDSSGAGAAVTHTFAKSGVYQSYVDVSSGQGSHYGYASTTVVVCGKGGDRCSDTDLDSGPPCCAGLTCAPTEGFEHACQ